MFPAGICCSGESHKLLKADGLGTILASPLLPVGFWPKFLSFLCLATASLCIVRLQARVAVCE